MEENNQISPFNIYCNGVKITVSPFDFSMELSNNTARGEQFLGEIKMSPEHTKAFANILMQHVQQFEELFGDIPQMNPEKVAELQKQGKVKVEERK
jgi:hypothetical protein